jgi:hypothetical protein
LRERAICYLTTLVLVLPSHAEAFLKQVSAVIPSGYRVEIDDELLWIVSPDGGKAGSSTYWLTSDALLDEEAINGGVASLHHIQREIAEDTREPWPAASGPGYIGFPEPDGAVVDAELHLWFGDRATPVLAFDPIDLSDVLLRD